MALINTGTRPALTGGTCKALIVSVSASSSPITLGSSPSGKSTSHPKASASKAKSITMFKPLLFCEISVKLALEIVMIYSFN